MSLDFLFLRSYGIENALARLQSNPLNAGLKSLGYASHLIQYKPGERLEIPDKVKWLIVHHDDSKSILFAKKLKGLINCKVGCFTSDIYNYDHYIEIESIVDVFIAPTELHRKTLQYAVNKDVVHIPEGIDPIAYSDINTDEPNERSNRICWFGYPESFDKSFKYVIRLLEKQNRFTFGELTLITSEGVRLHPVAEHLTFSSLNFYEQTGNFGYSLLSHFPYDRHINTFIKSPNKFITSIVRGMVPIASNTESYSKIAGDLGLANLLCDSPNGFAEKIYNREFTRDFENYEINKCREKLIKEFSPINISNIFLNKI